MDINNKINEYKRIKGEIYQDFSVNGWELIEDYRECKFNVGDGYLGYYNNDEYNFDSAVLVGENDDLEMYYVSDNGDVFYAIFCNENKLTYDEYEIFVENELK